MEFKKMTIKSSDNSVEKSTKELKMVRVTYTFPMHINASIEDVASEIYNICDMIEVDGAVNYEESLVQEADVKEFLKSQKDWLILEPDSLNEIPLKNYINDNNSAKKKKTKR